MSEVRKFLLKMLPHQINLINSYSDAQLIALAVRLQSRRDVINQNNGLRGSSTTLLQEEKDAMNPPVFIIDDRKTK